MTSTGIAEPPDMQYLRLLRSYCLLVGVEQRETYIVGTPEKW